MLVYNVVYIYFRSYVDTCEVHSNCVQYMRNTLVLKEIRYIHFYIHIHTHVHTHTIHIQMCNCRWITFMILDLSTFFIWHTWNKINEKIGR